MQLTKHSVMCTLQLEPVRSLAVLIVIYEHSLETVSHARHCMDKQCGWDKHIGNNGQILGIDVIGMSTEAGKKHP